MNEASGKVHDEWKAHARAGAPSSARSPSVHTPEPLFKYPFEADGTPAPLVKPMRKAEIQAQARLQSQLKEMSKTKAPAPDHVSADGNQAAGPARRARPGPTGSDEKGEVSEEAVAADLEAGDSDGHENKKKMAPAAKDSDGKDGKKRKRAPSAGGFWQVRDREPCEGSAVP